MIISPSLLAALYYILLFISIVASVSFIYHWKKYGTHLKIVAATIVLYLIVTSFLLITAYAILRTIAA